MIEKIKSTYEEILELNIQINSLFDDFSTADFAKFNEKLQKLLNLKDEYIQELFSLKVSLGEDFTRVKETKLKEISEQVDNLEKENFKLIHKKKDFLADELNKANRAAKALDGYKFNKQTDPRIFDESD